MSTGILSIGISGIRAAQMGLMTTEHNITNAGTPNYSRQRIIQSTNVPLATGAGFVGQGTHVSTVERIYSQTLVNQMNTAQSKISALDMYYTQVKHIDNMLADERAGLSPALQEYFTGVQDVVANPAMLPARQSMISSAQALVARFQSIEGRLAELHEGVGNEIITTVASINSYAQQLAQLNQRIVLAEAATQSPANDLLDQRDRLMTELNKLVAVRSVENSDGSFNVFFGTGQQLVVGPNVNELTAQASSTDISRIAVGLVTGGAVQELPEKLLTGGALSGLLSFRSELLDRTSNEVGRLAATLALTTNAQHALGQDLLGQIAGQGSFVPSFFTVSSPRISVNSRNSGNAVLETSFVPPSAGGSYRLELDGAGTTYTLTRLSDGEQWSAATLDALQLAVPSRDGVTREGLSKVNTPPVAAGRTATFQNSSAASGSFYTNLTNSDYRLVRSGASYTLTRLSDNQSWTNTSLSDLSKVVAASEGFEFSMTSGAIADGDSFIIMPTRFAARDMAVASAIAADPRLIAAAMPIRTAAHAENSGTGLISPGTMVPGATGFLSATLPVELTYDAALGTFAFPASAGPVSLTVGTSTVVYPAGTTSIPYSPQSGATISMAGFSYAITGTPSNGDRFTISANTAGSADSRNALAFAQLQTKGTVSGGTANLQVAYSRLVSDAGNKTREIQVTASAQQTLLIQAENAREAMSGVNLDEEAANLMRYQQAYQASAKALDIGNRLFDVILSLRT